MAIIKSNKSCLSRKAGVHTIYDIIKAHGGEIKVESPIGGGTEFIIHLPTV
jgi:signal transduction histidine kinase